MADKKYNYKENMQKAYSYMKDKLGYSDQTARALIGNFMQESNLDPNVVNSIGATGIAQWLGARKKELKKQPNWDTLEGQLDFMDKEFRTTEKKAWEAIESATSINEASDVVRKKYERPGEEEANDLRRRRFANFDSDFEPKGGEALDEAIRKGKKNEKDIEDYLNTPRKEKDQIDIPKVGQVISEINGQKIRVTPDYVKKWLIDHPEAQAQEIDREIKAITKKREEQTPEVQKKEIEKKIENGETITPEEQSRLDKIKADIKAEADAEDLTAWDKKFAKFNDSFATPEKIKGKGFSYDKKDFKRELPLDVLASGALGLMGLAQTDVKIPLDESKVGQATLAYLNETKRLSKLGLPPEMEAEAKRNLKESTKVGIDNLTRASGGDRNLVLANLGGLDTARAKGISALAIADQQAKDAAFAEYGKTLKHIDQFEQSKDRYNLRIEDREAQKKRQDGENLANAGFSKMMDDIAYQRENGPGSANDMYKKQIMFEMFGQVHGMADDGSGTKKGTKSYKEAQDKKEALYNMNTEIVVAERERVNEIYNSLGSEEKISLQRSGFDPATAKSSTIQSKEDLLGQYVEGYQTPEGFSSVEATPIDKDTFKDQYGKNNRMTGFGNQSFDSRESNQPGGTGLNWWDAYANENKVAKVTGDGAYGRNLTELGVQADGRTYDSAFLQNKFDPVNFYDVGNIPETLEEIMASNKNPYLGKTPEQFRKKQ